MRLLLIFTTIVLVPHLFLNSDDFLLAAIGEQQLVHPQEGLLEGSLIIFSLVVVVG